MSNKLIDYITKCNKNKCCLQFNKNKCCLSKPTFGIIFEEKRYFLTDNVLCKRSLIVINQNYTICL